MATNENQLYIMYLEDYRKNRYTSKLRPYIGSRKDFMDFAQRLAQDEDAAIRFHETIEGIDLYEINPDVVHTMAGQEIPVMTPMTELARTYLELTDPEWTHPFSDTSMYDMRCDYCEMEVVLGETSDKLLLGVRGRLDNVCASVLDMELSHLTCSDGFPGVCTSSGSTNRMHLFTVACKFDLNQKELALQAMQYPEFFDLDEVFADALQRLRFFL